MKLQDEYIFGIKIEDVWEQIFAADAFAAFVPGSDGLSETSPGEYAGVIAVNLFLFRSELAVRLKILEQDRPAYCRFVGQCTGELGAIYTLGTLRFEDKAGKTLLKYEADFEFEGSLGKLAGRTIESSGKSRLQQKLRELESKMLSRLALKA